MAEPQWPVAAPAAPAAQSPGPVGGGGTPGNQMDLREQRGALLRLVVVVVAGLVVAEVFGALATVLVVLSLIVMIILHEFGHFVAAKRAGMKVTEFFVGFGPRLWSVQKGETTYGVKALPFGGYCRIIGMTSAEVVDPEDEPRAYRNQPTWRRLTVACAGSFVHFVLAFIMLIILFVGPGDIGNFITNPPATNPIAAVDGFTTGKSPAQQAGLQAGDRIVTVNGQHFATWSRLSDYLKARPGQTVRITVDRHGHIINLRPVVLANGAKVIFTGTKAPLYNRPTGLLGVEVGTVVKFGLGGAIEHAGTAFGSTVVYSVTSIGHVVGNIGGYVNMISNQKAAATGKRFVSPIGVVKLANEATQVGWSEVLYLLILINIFIGIFNMVPLLPMDGGHVVIALYEKVRSTLARHPYHADVNKMAPVVYVVFAVLLFYAVTAMFMDLRQILT
jgi:membrane-associated protease RseP (regulator of RpoE activity)